jgi:hypothetical protein
VVKVQIAEKHPSGAKARDFLSGMCGTTEVVPFQNPTLTTGCWADMRGTRCRFQDKCQTIIKDRVCGQ